MSLFKSIVGGIVKAGKAIIKSPVAKAIAPVFGGPVGAALTVASTAYGAYSALKTPSVGSVSPGAGSVMAAPSRPIVSLPQLPRVQSMSMQQAGFQGMGALTSLGGAIGGAVMRSGRSVGKAAVGLCRKYPQWCATIGGTVAIESLLNSGQLPMPKRRRGKGITATELKNFRRVVKFTSKYCAPVHRAMRAPVMHKRR